MCLFGKSYIYLKCFINIWNYWKISRCKKQNQSRQVLRRQPLNPQKSKSPPHGKTGSVLKIMTKSVTSFSSSTKTEVDPSIHRKSLKYFKTWVFVTAIHMSWTLCGLWDNRIRSWTLMILLKLSVRKLVTAEPRMALKEFLICTIKNRKERLALSSSKRS